ncbi:restriction endonuclease [Entomospira culicis]|uniref:Restriction endonuclease type IV Mrr domain-containing protein n=1 Tax=Entomospira culicis TaxID=2719989 RepID=A0A968GFC2_9SPIO|nr:restriction endonuclease [Entomospira culicis]NIZ19529.1 hypothetical protein [Entomospira culicis]NIZ69566.1 hypothetical protein [Entomospira culicis]WDI36677.1 restriction endonuclease [Entomospira culicis]WDI38306.1 restriction endonuclease [Entomospira culicis]
MPRPTSSEMRATVLEFLKNGEQPLKEIHKHMSNKFQLDEEDTRKIYYPLTGIMDQLKKSHLTNNPRWGVWELTNEGSDSEQLAEVEALPETKLGDELVDADIKFTEDLNKGLLEKISTMNPYAFEHLVGALFEAMGYEVEVTKGSGDGGIDGFIIRDELKPENICFQVKRYKYNISVEAMRAFAHTVTKNKARLGIFITSGSFESGAIKVAEEDKIELIDGNRLASLLIKYNIGVKTHTIKTLDEDYEHFKK